MASAELAEEAGLESPEELGAGEDGMPNLAFQRAMAMKVQLQDRQRRDRGGR